MSWILFSLAIFLTLGALIIVHNDRLHLGTYEDLSIFYSAYYSWIEHLFIDLRSITGTVIGVDWIPDTNSTKSTQ
jgi:hypothetical protein